MTNVADLLAKQKLVVQNTHNEWCGGSIDEPDVQHHWVCLQAKDVLAGIEALAAES